MMVWDVLLIVPAEMPGAALMVTAFVADVPVAFTIGPSQSLLVKRIVAVVEVEVRTVPQSAVQPVAVQGLTI